MLIICAKDEVTLLSEQAASILSIGDPGDQAPEELQHFSSRLRLEFDDIESPITGHTLPTPADVEKAVHFIGEAPEPLLIHCFAGVSRSSACSLIKLLYVFGSEDFASMFETLYRLRPIAYPNRLIASYVDDSFGLEGALIEAVDQFRTEQNYRLRPRF
jgi:predicted protein tyrosine phosphatase